MNDARRKGLKTIAMVAGVGLLAWGGWHWFEGRYQQHTDNAYVAAHVVQITPQISGTVAAVLAEETDFVQPGQPLVRLDPADAEVALRKARAELAQTVREVRTLFANNAALQAQMASRQADWRKAQVTLSGAQEDVQRRATLVDSGAVGQEEFEHAQTRLTVLQNDVVAAQAAWNAAHEAWVAGTSRTEGTTLEAHPTVQAAAARYREAWLQRQRLVLAAPVAGHVAKRNVQWGQRVQAGAPLMTVAALDRVWVDANFKESQLQSLRIGQPATLHADVYGNDVEYHGKVAGLGAGTGAAFALLPAQNATGNWIKVVQRVPVRIVLDEKEVQQHPLRVGLSMVVSVDTRDRSGKVLSDTTASAAEVSAQGGDEASMQPADAEIERIIAAHRGPAMVGTRP